MCSMTGWPCSRATKEANLAGCLSECNPKLHYDGQPASPTAGARGCAPMTGWPCSRATKQANLAGCLSECYPKLHYDGQPASPTAGARGCAPWRAGPVRERRRRRIWRAACQSAIQVCDEIESKNRPFHRDTVIFAWQTMGPRAVPSASPASQSRLSDPQDSSFPVPLDIA